VRRQSVKVSDWATYDNFIDAMSEVRIGKRMHNSFNAFYSRFPVHLTDSLEAIHGSFYEAKPFRKFTIFDRKERVIEAPAVIDRVVQHALLRVIGQRMESHFIDQTYACRAGKGTHAASNQLQQYLREYTGDGYFLKFDVRKFFYSINQQILWNQIERLYSFDDCTARVVRAFVFANGTGKGIPIGCVISQHFANLALSPLDYAVKRDMKMRHYVRYMDDSIVLSRSKSELHSVMGDMVDVLGSLGMEVNKKSGIARIDKGVDFVGYRTWWNHKLIRKSSLFRIRRALRKSWRKERVASFIGHARGTGSEVYVMHIIKEMEEKYGSEALLSG
jgi:RNA-directed DNA polymerase